MGAIVMVMGTLAAVLFLIAYNSESQVASVVAGGLMVTLKDMVHLFGRATDPPSK